MIRNLIDQLRVEAHKNLFNHAARWIYYPYLIVDLEIWGSGVEEFRFTCFEKRTWTDEAIAVYLRVLWSNRDVLELKVGGGGKPRAFVSIDALPSVLKSSIIILRRLTFLNVASASTIDKSHFYSGEPYEP